MCVFVHVCVLQLFVQLWEVPVAETVSGPESHLSVAFADVSAIIIVFDASNAASFSAVDNCRDVIAGRIAAGSVPLFLVGNKEDRRQAGDASHVSNADVANYARACGFSTVMWTGGAAGVCCLLHAATSC